MKIRKKEPPLTKFQMAPYTDGALANVCWSPDTTDRISDKVGPHVHSFYEIVFIESGSGSHVINGERIEAGPGQLFLLGPGSSHDPVLLQTAAIWVFIFNAHALDAEGWEGAIHTTSGRTLDAAYSLLRAVHADERRHLAFRIPAGGRPGLSAVLRRMQGGNASRRARGGGGVKATRDLLLIDLLRRHDARRPAEVGQRHPMVARAMDFIDDNFRRAIGLLDIAKHVGRSPAYLTNLVSCHTGRPVMAWLSDRRLVEARNLILTSPKSVQEVSEAVGYENISHFSHMFKRKYGDSPANWRGKIQR